MIDGVLGPLGIVHGRHRDRPQRLQRPPVAAGAALTAGLRGRRGGTEQGKANGAGNDAPVCR